MMNLLLWVFYFMTLYAFIPALASRLFGIRVFKRGRAKQEIALTFDDGPDGDYTPQLLDLLKQYDAKATFFVVGSHAEHHPELLQRMHQEGHIIGIHNYVHKTNWFMLPRTVTRHIAMTNDLIEKATGVRAAYYRPPWGIMNLFDFRSVRLQVVLWSALFGDWNAKVGAKRLTERMMKKLRPGEVLLLHDCGRTPGADPEAPGDMLIALEHYLKEGAKRGYRFVAIDEMMELTKQNEKKQKQIPFWKKTIVSCWLVYEKAFQAVFHLKHGGDFFHYRLIKYSGQTLKLADGREIAKGDTVVELHFDNKKLSNIAMQSKSLIATVVRLKRETLHGIGELADYLAKDEKARVAKAVFGITMIHRGAERTGFELFPLPKGLFARLTRFYLHMLMRVLSNSSNKGEGISSLDPRILVMPMNRLLAHSGDEAQFLSASEKRTAASAESKANVSLRDDGDSVHGNTPAL
ncbi:polysaccharide deacetylase family protein [Paenibacillus protaetiae]|uniref:Polysaccharide deacetylase family protein n=1 Tax=Paenibacillus protaetiae TaxID=2509456 RepID=A0A4P6EQU1_9BACL|nr:polysaccharide deacetylase family protein [Paenibacillus protaetiae]QAY65212.1 polysaccharide deacetylase family protein [Paenibacillus protaetiae]